MNLSVMVKDLDLEEKFTFGSGVVTFLQEFSARSHIVWHNDTLIRWVALP